MPPLYVVLVTSPTIEIADDIARNAVENRLAACCTRLPSAVSTYRWEGKVETETECQLLLKTTEDRLDALFACVRDIHPFDVPEMLALPVQHAFGAYADWVRTETNW